MVEDLIVAQGCMLGPWLDRLGARVEARAGLPANAERVFYYPGGRAWSPWGGQVVEFAPHGEQAWLGVFEAGGRGAPEEAVIVACPQPGSAVVAYQGDAYGLQVGQPRSCEELHVNAVRELLISEGRQLVLVIGDQEMCGLGPQGLAWLTRRFALDGYRIDGVHGDLLLGVASAPGPLPTGESMRPFRLNLVDGTVSGGYVE